jgi:hypothetical protein
MTLNEFQAVLWERSRQAIHWKSPSAESDPQAGMLEFDFKIGGVDWRTENYEGEMTVKDNG